jgi:alanine dehydrogenase
MLRRDVLHRCVAKMPPAVPPAPTFTLANAIFPYFRSQADLGMERLPGVGGQ